MMVHYYSFMIYQINHYGCYYFLYLSFCIIHFYFVSKFCLKLLNVNSIIYLDNRIISRCITVF